MTSTVQNNTIPSDLLAAMNPSKKSEQTATEETQDRFMTLLVTQMKNQDPLNPLDNAQVTSQMAQLSTVTGIDKLNTTLEALQGSYQVSQSLQAASMIGHGVLVPGSSTQLADGKAFFGIELTDPADNVEVTIRDANGKTVHSFNLGSQEPGVLPLQWDGATDSGATAADGTYKIEVTATRGKETAKAATLAFGQVLSVATGAQGVKLSVPGVGDVAVSDIRQIL